VSVDGETAIFSDISLDSYKSRYLAACWMIDNGIEKRRKLFTSMVHGFPPHLFLHPIEGDVGEVSG
jgi:hypothetical protein